MLSFLSGLSDLQIQQWWPYLITRTGYVSWLRSIQHGKEGTSTKISQKCLPIKMLSFWWFASDELTLSLCFRYKRIFSFGTCGVTTYNPESFEITNRWPYSDIASIRRAPDKDKSSRFMITVKKDKNRKNDTMYFSTENRAELLTTASKYSHLFIEKAHESPVRVEKRIKL